MTWIKIGTTDNALNNKGRLFIVNEKKIAVFNINNEFFAIDNKCPHAGVDLCNGDVTDKVLTCPAHGWQFNLETGEGVILPVGVKKYEIKVENDDLMLNI
jgi:nitrite reductase (NADH) small subunit